MIIADRAEAGEQCLGDLLAVDRVFRHVHLREGAAAGDEEQAAHLRPRGNGSGRGPCK